MDKIICVAGPTASGKTAFAVALAKEVNGEVISCDSMQIYKGMDIGTAKPTTEEMDGIPHYMLDVADPRDDFSVSRYCELADPIIQDILSRGKTPIIAGGTGLYMDALMRGNSFAACPSTGMRERLESQADQDGMQAMLDLLKSIDPEAASRLHLADRKRILRALEVYYETGRTITAHNKMTQQIPPRYQPLWFGLNDADRNALYKRIDNRVLDMLDAGLIDEIHALLDQGISEKCTAMQAIGYKECLAALAGRCTMQEAVSSVQQSSRHYAKRQLTWFRRNQQVHWLIRQEGEKTAEIINKARPFLGEFDN